MLVVPGGIYRLDLVLEQAQGSGPSWLAAAISSALQGAELAAVEHYAPPRATALIRWRAAEQQLEPGAQITAQNGVFRTLGTATPRGTVTGLEEALLDELPQGSRTGLKLLGAVALVVVTALLCRRIGGGGHA